MHFDFEEKEIFPIILTKGTEEEKTLIQELREQHVIIFKVVAQVKKLILTVQQFALQQNYTVYKLLFMNNVG